MNQTEQLIRAYFDAFNAHDASAMLGTLSDDVIHDINEGATEVGIEAFRKFKIHMDHCYLEHISEMTIFVNGDKGAAEFLCSGEYLRTDGDLPAATGQKYAIPAAAFFTVRDGKISRITSYYNLNGWLKAIAG